MVDFCLQYPIIVNVTTSVDDVLRQDMVIEEDIATRYSSYDRQGSGNVWFLRACTTRYWTTCVVEFVGHASLKYDVIGKSWQIHLKYHF